MKVELAARPLRFRASKVVAVFETTRLPWQRPRAAAVPRHDAAQHEVLIGRGVNPDGAVSTKSPAKCLTFIDKCSVACQLRSTEI